MKLNDISQPLFPINEGVDRDKVISWISHNPELRLNKVGGQYPHERYRNFSMVVSKQDIAAGRPPEVVGMRYDLESDELQRALSNFERIGHTPDEDVDMDLADDFMNDAAFYALCSAKRGNIVFGIAIYSMDDPRFQDTDEDEDDIGMSDEELFGLSPDEMRQAWGEP